MTMKGATTVKTGRRAGLAAMAALLASPLFCSPVVISAGEEWIPVENRRDIVPGSALDFSAMGFADAPAGRFGWLRCVGGHFEFEGLPGEAQRFYGVNLCFTANFPDHAAADAAVARFRRLGYNSVRIHHHDGGSVEGSGDGLSLDPDKMDRLDYLVAAAAKAGLYVTTDMYVSRPVKWRQIGVDLDGGPSPKLFKALVYVYGPAFDNWAAYARGFMLHRNPYTGRTYAEEPAMPLVSLVNEGGSVSESGGEPIVLEAWSKWLAAKRAADPAFCPEARCDVLPRGIGRGDATAALALWEGEIAARAFDRMRGVMRGMGCRALLTDKNHGPHYVAVRTAGAGYDYVDDHFYVDHPSFPERPWQLPSRCDNRNPLLGKAVPPSSHAFARIFGKPFTVTEWNFAGPGRWRAVGGLLTGALAARQDWSGLWRFAYSHDADGLAGGAKAGPRYFDLASDPLAQASERAAICLFLRGDMEPLSAGVALWATPVSHMRAKPRMTSPSWCRDAWSMKVGTCLSPTEADGLRVVCREDAEQARGEGFPEAALAPKSLRIDRDRGAMAVETARTCGGFAPEGAVDAGGLKFEVEAAPAAVWASSVDGAPLAKSRRMLVTHLTDVQGEGAEFADEAMTTIVKWGSRPLARRGAAKIALAVGKPGAYTVYELAMDGRRMGVVPSSEKSGCLCFEATVDGPNGARMLYEVAR